MTRHRSPRPSPARRWRASGGRAKGAARHRLRPYRQGDLDGLCGVYAIVNAVRWLAPDRLGPAGASALFGALVGAVRGFDRGHHAVAHEGMTRRQLLKLVAVARGHLAREHGLAVMVERAPAKPGRRWSVASLWRLLEGRFARGQVAILVVDGRERHWTTVVAVTPGQLRLFDSSGMAVLRRRHLASAEPMAGRATHAIDAADIVLIGLDAPEP